MGFAEWNECTSELDIVPFGNAIQPFREALELFKEDPDFINDLD